MDVSTEMIVMMFMGAFLLFLTAIALGMKGSKTPPEDKQD